MQILEELVKLAACSKFKYQENTRFVVKPSEEAKDVRVVEAVLDLDLAPEMSVETVLLELLLENHLQCHYVSALIPDLREDSYGSVRFRD